MKKSVYFGLFVALTVFISTVMISVMLPSVALAEFICRQSVVYHWQKEKEDKPSEVHWIAVEAKGADEVIAKRALAEPAEKEKKRAHEECQKKSRKSSRMHRR